MFFEPPPDESHAGSPERLTEHRRAERVRLLDDPLALLLQEAAGDEERRAGLGAPLTDSIESRPRVSRERSIQTRQRPNLRGDRRRLLRESSALVPKRLLLRKELPRDEVQTSDPGFRVAESERCRLDLLLGASELLGPRASRPTKPFEAHLCLDQRSGSRGELRVGFRPPERDLLPLVGDRVERRARLGRPSPGRAGALGERAHGAQRVRDLHVTPLELARVRECLRCALVHPPSIATGLRFGRRARGRSVWRRMISMPAPAPAAASRLVPFVPRLTIDWLREEPRLRWREVDGTLAFVDISGFTSMSERLSSRGKAGAEEVTDIMNSTFAALLEIAYSLGGGLLKFGGDALLLLFTGENHTARAARASFQMRRRLRAIGRPRTTGGVVELRMHVGLHCGLFHFFLVGESHLELLVSGPAATKTVEMESASEAGEILLSDEAAAALGASALLEQTASGFLLKKEPDVAGDLDPLPDVSSVPIELAVPSRLRKQLLEIGPLEGEHRNAAIAFLRFTGVDELIAREGPAGAAASLDSLVSAIQRAAEAHDVTFLESDVNRDGGRIILVAGAPETSGNDEERLLRALRVIVDAGLPLPVHIGASRGRVFAGQVGAPFRRTYTILGDTAALAARLMGRAAANEVWVSTDAFRRGGGPFQATELEPFSVKGKRELVRAHALGRLTGAAASPRDGKQLPFVDRERERAVLAASVAPVRVGFGSLVELIGEAGIGKSRLSDELRTLCDDMRTLTARCEQYEASTPYHAFGPILRSVLDVELNGGGRRNRELLSQRLQEIDPELAAWAPLLAAPLNVDVDTTPEVEELDNSFRRARLHGVVATLLGQLLDEPTLLVFEDVHWMDEASSELLRHLGTQLSTRPWLTCTTRRPAPGGFVAAEGTPPLPALTLRLEPLPPEDAKALARSAADHALSDDEVLAIAERAAGNPLFLQELASDEEEREGTKELPETVEALVAIRIDRLAPRDRALLRWASVLGSSFSAALISDVLSDDPAATADPRDWDRLAEFIERDPDVAGGFRFRHVLIRDAAYEGLSYRRRRELHARVGEVVEERAGESADEAAELLSLHYLRAGRSTEAWRYAVLAGRRAQSKWSNVEAAEFYRRALDAVHGLRSVAAVEIASVWEALGDVLQLSGELDDAGRAFSTARRLLPKHGEAQIALMRKEGALRELMGKYSDALRWYGRGLKAAGELTDDAQRTRTQIRFRLAHAQVRFRQGTFHECIRLSRQVVDEALAVADTESLAPAYLLLHLVHTVLGSPERAAFRGLALPLYEDLGDLSGQAAALNNMGIEAYYEGDWPLALELYDRSRALRRRLGDVTNVAMQTSNIAEILSDQGHVDEAARLFSEVERTCDVAGQRLMATVARSNLGRAAARAGRLDEAESLLTDALEVFRDMHAASFALETEIRLAEVDIQRGDRPEEALARTRAVLDVTEDAADTVALHASALRLRAAARLQLGDADGAREDLVRSIETARGAGTLYEVALAFDLRAQLDGDRDTAAEARTLFEKLGVEHVARPPARSSAA